MLSLMAHKWQWMIALIVGFLMLLLSLGAVLLVSPALTTAQGATDLVANAGPD